MHISEKRWYKWVIAAVCFLMVFIALGFCSSSRDLYLGAITEAWGFDRAAYGLTDTFRFLTCAVVNIFFGALVGKFGEKKLMLGGMTALFCSCMAFSLANRLWQFYLASMLFGVGFSWCSTTIVGHVIGKWFKENKGSVMGAVLSANGLGVAVAVRMVVPLINTGIYGYKSAYRLLAALVLGMAVVLLIFFKEPKTDGDAPKLPAKKKPSRGSSWEGITFKDALKKPYTYVAAVCLYFICASLQGTVSIKSAILKDTGLGDYVTMAASVYSLTLLTAKFLAGFSFDKLGLRVTMMICQIAGIAGFFMMSRYGEAGADTWMYVFGANLLLGCALPLETIMLPLIAADMFGEKDYSKILGIVISISMIGFASGAPIVNLAYDKMQNYRTILAVMAVLMVVVMVAFQFVLGAAAKERRALTAQQNSAE